MKKAKEDKDVVVVTAATPKICGFTPDLREEYGERFVDVAIAEEHAIAMISGLAKAGKKPVFGVNSSFIQRAYDQISQELALNKMPAVIIVYKSGITAANATHLGLFDVALTKSIPNLVCMSPTNPTEYLSVLEWAINQTENPVIIRMPSGIIEDDVSLETNDKNYSSMKYEIVEKGSKACILGLGNFLKIGKKAAEILKEKYNFSPSLINPLYSNILDTSLLDELAKTHSVFATIEDGVLAGGFGESVSSYLSKKGITVLNFGADRLFTDNVPLNELREKFGITSENIASVVAKKLK